ncbi:hypothetical protein AYK20_07550 [Thermoplasmatales archaeon SG8-52-1]|nr:MAG: hypothetical protein AYK20_07550 [Thermoplasmatales archaeon SG8-52-1]
MNFLSKKKNILYLIFIFLIISIILSNIATSIKLGEQKKLILDEFDADIIIPDDYLTINEGIKKAEPWDKIFVRSGVYKENIIIDKVGLEIFGENKQNTVIDGGKTEFDAIKIIASNVKIQGFTITNACNEKEELWDISGVKICSSNITIKGNIISYNKLGLSVITPVSNLTIADNNFIDDGILLGNYLVTYTININDFLHNITNNTVNGKPLYYYKNQKDLTVQNDAGQVILANCSNITIEDLYINNCDFSIILGYCLDCTIENSTIYDTNGELFLIKSDNNTIQNNIMINNLHGVCIDFGSSSNIIRYNTIKENNVGISILTTSHHNMVYGNEITDNVYGIYITGYKFRSQHNNTIFNNHVSDNYHGIVASKKSFNNNFMNNSIFKNNIGLRLNDESDGNIISNNLFKKNRLSATFNKCRNNIWYNNYWSRPRLLPKFVFGTRKIGNIGLPWINIDKNPMKRL